MRAPIMVIGNILRELTPERVLSEHDDVIQTLAANRTNEPFDIRPLPGRSRRRKHLFDSHRSHLLDKLGPKDQIPIAQQILGRAVPGKSFPQLLGGPLGGGMGRHRKMHDSSALVRQHQKHKQKQKPKQKNSEKSTDTIVFTFFPEMSAKSGKAVYDFAPCI